MTESEEFIIFLCTSAAKPGSKKLSFKIASHLKTMGIADIGSLQNLAQQQATPQADQKKMIFINDCRSGCVNVITQGFQKEKYIYIDVSPLLPANEFDVEKYVHAEILPTLNDKWNYSLPALHSG